MLPTKKNGRGAAARQRMRIVLLAGAVLVSPGLSLAQSSFRVEPAGRPQTSIPSRIRQKLEANGTRLLYTVNGIDSALCELWWVRNFPINGHPRRIHDVVYPQLVPGELLGILQLRQRLEDSQHQLLPPGLYTLRYARLAPAEADEDEKSSPASQDSFRDFVLLSRLVWDQSTALIQIGRLIDLSRKTSGTTRPAGLRLPPLRPAYANFPAVVSDDSGTCSVQFSWRRSGSAGGYGELALSIQLFNPPDVSADD